MLALHDPFVALLALVAPSSLVLALLVAALAAAPATGFVVALGRPILAACLPSVALLAALVLAHLVLLVAQAPLGA